MEIRITSEMIKEYGMDAGANVVGIAAAEDFGQAPLGFQPADGLPGCRSVVVLGVAFPKEALSVSTSEYTRMRNEMVSAMTAMAKKVEKRIRASGHAAKAISAIGGKFVEGKHYGHISLKHAAELAGLGQITRNYLLTNRQFGNLLWFSAVLTDANLVADEKVQLDICGGCNRCVEACPAGALEDPHAFGFSQCAKACWKMVDKKWELSCYLCRQICPHRFGEPPLHG